MSKGGSEIGDARLAAWSYREAYSEVGRISDLILFEPDRVTVQLDGKQLSLGRVRRLFHTTPIVSSPSPERFQDERQQMPTTMERMQMLIFRLDVAISALLIFRHEIEVRKAINSGFASGAEIAIHSQRCPIGRSGVRHSLIPTTDKNRRNGGDIGIEPRIDAPFNCTWGFN